MKKLFSTLLFAVFLFFTEGVLAQIPQSLDGLAGNIIGGAGFIKFDGGNPNLIPKIQSIDERYTSAFAWDTSINKLWQYQRNPAIGKRWTPTQFVQYTNGAVLRYDTAYKFIVDTTARQLYICNQSGCVNVTGGSAQTITVSSGLNIFGNDVKLGGVLTQTAMITTSAGAPLKLRGLLGGSLSDSLLVIDWFSGIVKRLNVADIQKWTHQRQKIAYSSAFVFNPNTGNVESPPPFAATVANNVSVVQFEDSNTNLYAASAMSVTLPEAPSVWNRRILFIPAKQTAGTLSNQSYMFDNLTFLPNTGPTILNTASFTNVSYNTVFEAQYLSDTNEWYISIKN